MKVREESQTVPDVVFFDCSGVGVGVVLVDGVVVVVVVSSDIFVE